MYIKRKFAFQAGAEDSSSKYEDNNVGRLQFIGRLIVSQWKVEFYALVGGMWRLTSSSQIHFCNW